MVREKLQPRHENDELASGKDLVLFNDEVHSFEFVIQALMDVCEHEPEQAEQCTMIAHYKGKCSVKQGSLSELKPPLRDLIRLGLTVSIE